MIATPRRRIAATLVTCATSLLFAFPLARLAHASDSRSIRVAGVSRSYRIHVPDDLPAGPAPLVFAFHGGGSHGKGMERVTGFDAIADREHFIVVYPDGLDKHWNDGREATPSTDPQRRTDDVEFVSELIDALGREHPVDARRVYATGISNGAIFANYLGARLANRIAAIAPVCGGVAERFAPEFAPERPVSVFVIQGTRDPLMPFDGGEVRPGNRGRIVPTKRTLELWTHADGLTAEPQRGSLPDTYAQDDCTVKTTRWSGGRDGAEVVYYEVDGGGHTWPGGYQYLPKLMIGRTCRDFDASQTIWEFFKAHPRP
jgi:polyhydroxybutyrate depolymerase